MSDLTERLRASASRQDALTVSIRLTSNPQLVSLHSERCSSLTSEAAARIDELERERAHSLGCEHHVDPPHRCKEPTCYRQWQADRIAELETALTNMAGCYEFEDDRISYVSVQMDRDLWLEYRTKEIS